MRIDKWAWAVRLVKTRSKAAELCKLGRITLNEEDVKPAKELKAGDLVELKFKGLHKKYRVLGFPTRRGPASEAATFFEDLSPPPAAKDGADYGRRDRGAGRPTKRERRDIDKLRWES